MHPVRCLNPKVVGLVAVVSALVGTAATGPASAEPYRAGHGPRVHSHSYVTAESHWGNGRASGPVRQGRHGPEVRLPGGTWVECVRSCSETLRKETVDYWQAHGNHAPDTGPGYFRWQRGW